MNDDAISLIVHLCLVFAFCAPIVPIVMNHRRGR